MQKVPFSFSWLIPIFWTTLSLSAGHGILQWNQTKTNLAAFKDWVDRFHKDYHRLPLQLAEVRAFAKIHHQTLIPYDSHGVRLQYIPLTDDDYIIKSFGPDAQENSFQSPVDPAVGTLASREHGSIQPATLSQSIPQFYQAAFLDGASAPDSGLIASVEVHNLFQMRQLLVRSPKNADFYMVAFHDMVEEFLWLPGGSELIFTAFGSQRYEDGIFYWNLKENTIHNILPDLRKQFWADLPADQQFHCALSHVSHDPALIYLMLAPDDDEELNPKEFYSFKNMLAIPISDELANKAEGQRIQTELAFTAFDYPFPQERLVKAAEMASPAQREWLSLSLQGDTEDLINAWQEFSSSHADSPMCAYGLWWLSSVYNDAFRQLSTQDKSQALVIRNFGVEMVDALITMPTAPRYLQSMGRYLKKHLLLSQAANYNVTSLSNLR